MERTAETDALTALGHPGRLAVFRLLARRAPGGIRPSEIADALGLKHNTLSVYVTTLSRAGLVTSERAGKSVFYRINLDRVAELTTYLVADCCRGRPELCEPLAARVLGRLDRGAAKPADRVFNVLFVCTGNAARSIIAEAILNDAGAGRFRAFSAGTNPDPAINPYAIDLLQQLGHDTSRLRAKSVAEFQGPDAPRMDFAFTVCDRAANQECPSWPGQPMSAHWGVEDPVAAGGTEAEKAQAFRAAYHTIRTRLASFAELSFDALDRISLQGELDRIGRTGEPLLQSAARKR